MRRRQRLLYVISQARFQFQQVHTPFLERHYRWPLVLENVLVRMDANHQLCSQSSSLQKSPCMSCQDALDSMMTYLFCLTVVAEVETPIYPDSIFRNGLVVLWIYWPLTRSRDLFFLRRRHCQSS